MRVFVAVVDKLGLTGNNAKTGLPTTIGSPHGCDGVAYLLTDHDNVYVRTEDDQGVDAKKSLNFVFASKQPKLSMGEFYRINWPSSSTTAGLPLANTIFQTGKLATFYRSEWQFADEHTGWHQSEAPIELTSATITWPSHLPASFGASTACQAQGLSVQLIPLTLPRVVDASMGNVVRQLRLGLEGNLDVVPASSELQTAITKYFKVCKKPPRALAVWAMVSPGFDVSCELGLEARPVWEQLPQAAPLYSAHDAQVIQREIKLNWTHKVPTIPDTIHSNLLNGGHLHRVLSGGGDWGKKAGLISLDPGDELFNNFSSADETSKRGASEEILSQIAKPGDMIQFFIQPTQVQTPSTELASQPSTEAVEAQELSVGVVPSTIDEQRPKQTKVPDNKAEFTISRGACKILTESALHIRGHNSKQTRHSFKLDVPYAYLTSRRYLRGDSERGSVPSGLGAESSNTDNRSGASLLNRRHEFSTSPTPFRIVKGNFTFVGNFRSNMLSRASYTTISSASTVAQTVGLQNTRRFATIASNYRPISSDSSSQQYSANPAARPDSAVGTEDAPHSKTQSEKQTIQASPHGETESDWPPGLARQNAMLQHAARKAAGVLHIRTIPKIFFRKHVAKEQPITIRKVIAEETPINFRVVFAKGIHRFFRKHIKKERRSIPFRDYAGEEATFATHRPYWLIQRNKIPAMEAHERNRRLEEPRTHRGVRVRRPKTSEHADVTGAWRRFDRHLRTRELHREEGMKSSYAAAHAHLSKDRGKGAVTDIALEYNEMDEVAKTRGL
ncbi:MAG: hypothetical protein M1822_003066 [Bathelium mastoideum]|nr:MAG: hypothetical protein M1822_003066 [Bathelium mastoideum]